MLFNALYKYLKKQSFQPDFLSLFLNPFFFIRSSLYRGIKLQAPNLKGKLMDFGCGRKPYRNLFSVDEYIGVDIEQAGHDHSNSEIDFFYNGKVLPFMNKNFDSIFCSEVLEHVFNPDEIIPELNRVLKSNGKILITVPFCWNEHEVPYDYARYSSFGIVALLEKNGFEIVEQKKTGSFVPVLFQLWSLYFFELFRKLGKMGYFFSMMFIIPMNLVGSVLQYLFPKNHSMYFNNVVLAKKIN
ncbi:MAG TPA: methyltransferase domain-containing protein [Chitinophagaceae bacterium]|nr:methyltransferase domain-containing protein [Chitinophagaceae bacterium]